MVDESEMTLKNPKCLKSSSGVSFLECAILLAVLCVLVSAGVAGLGEDVQNKLNLTPSEGGGTGGSEGCRGEFCTRGPGGPQGEGGGGPSGGGGAS